MVDAQSLEITKDHCKNVKQISNWERMNEEMVNEEHFISHKTYYKRYLFLCIHREDCVSILIIHGLNTLHLESQWILNSTSERSGGFDFSNPNSAVSASVTKCETVIKCTVYNYWWNDTLVDGMHNAPRTCLLSHTKSNIQKSKPNVIPKRHISFKLRYLFCAYNCCMNLWLIKGTMTNTPHNNP